MVTDLSNPSDGGGIRVTSNPESDPDWGVPCPGGCTGGGGSPPPSKVRRTVTLALKGSLTAAGLLRRLDTNDPVGCVRRQKVMLQRKAGATWKTVKTATTTNTGHYSKLLPDVAGTYRALAPKVDRTTQDHAICNKAVSKSRTYSG